MGPTISSENLLTDNPELYEHQFPDPEHDAARFVHDLVNRFGGGRTVLDIGCGTGRDLGYLASIGYHTIGLDLSEHMINYAAAQWPKIEFVRTDMRSFSLGCVVDVIMCMDSTLLHCHSTDGLLEVLRRCAAHLVSGGLLIAEMRNGAFFLGNTELLDGTRTRTVTWQGIPYTSHTTLWIEHGAQLLHRLRRWEWPGCATPLEQRSAWRLLFPEELRLLLRLTGFEVIALFDQPGPRAELPWHPDAELSTALSGDRLHVVARRRADDDVTWK